MLVILSLSPATGHAVPPFDPKCQCGFPHTPHHPIHPANPPSPGACSMGKATTQGGEGAIYTECGGVVGGGEVAPAIA